MPRIVGKIKRRAPAIVDDLRFAKAQTDKPIKMDVPGPMTVIDSTLDEFYKDEAAMAMDVAAALNEELRDLQAAGCDVLEIDEPAMTRYHEKVFAYGAKALDRCLEGIHIPTVVHLCYGYPGGAGQQHEYEYPELLEELMKTKNRRLRRRVRPQQVTTPRCWLSPKVESSCSAASIRATRRCRSMAKVVERVRTALKYIEPKNLWLAPDCGLMTISRDLANAKAKLLVDVAKEVRKTL